jgi:hypothetical protein
MGWFGWFGWGRRTYWRCSDERRERRDIISLYSSLTSTLAIGIVEPFA